MIHPEIFCSFYYMCIFFITIIGCTYDGKLLKIFQHKLAVDVAPVLFSSSCAEAIVDMEFIMCKQNTRVRAITCLFLMINGLSLLLLLPLSFTLIVIFARLFLLPTGCGLLDMSKPWCLRKITFSIAVSSIRPGVANSLNTTNKPCQQQIICLYSFQQ